MTCSNPFEPDVLVDYWLAALPADEEERVEAHLLGCDACGDRLRETIALAEALRGLARSGALIVVISDRLVTRATEMGQRVRQYAAAPGDAVQCTVSADDDLLVARLAADLTGAARVDLSWRWPDGTEILRMADIPIRGDAGELLCQQSVTMAKASGSNTMIARLLASDPEHGERLLGEYTFHHTRTIPGPPDPSGAF